jgi:transcriptional regulator with XRE-family HTH domain
MGATQKEIARRVGLDVSSVNKILNHRQGPVFRKETIKKVEKVAREMGYNFEKLKHAHRRVEPRKDISLPVELSIYQKDGSLFDRGTALAQNLSNSGALLSAVVLPGRSLPIGPWTLGIRVVESAPWDPEVVGRPVRFQGDEWGVNLAMEFLTGEKPKAKELLAQA